MSFTDSTTDVPGVVLRVVETTYEGKKYTMRWLIIDLRQISDFDLTIDELSNRFHLGADEVFAELVGNQWNIQALQILYRQQVGDPGPNPPSLDDQRAQLKAKGAQFQQIKDTPNQYHSEERYHKFPVDRVQVQKIVLPAKGFEDVMKQATFLSKNQARVGLLALKVDDLKKKLAQIQQVTERLARKTENFKNNCRTGAREIGILDAVDGLLRAMRDNPKVASDESSSDRTKVTSLIAKVEKLRAECLRPLALDPPGFDKDTRGDNDADALVAAIEDATFRQDYLAIVNNSDIAHPEDWTTFLEVMQNAYLALMDSSRCDHILTNHVLPAFTNVAANKEINLDACTMPSKADFEKAIKTAPAPLNDTNLLTTLAGLASIQSSAVGNLPGPSSFLVAVGSKAMPRLMTILARGKTAADLQKAQSVGAITFRFIVKVASLDATESQTLATAVDKGDLATVGKIKWASKFMASPEWGRAMAIANMICFIAAITADDDDTFRKCMNIASTGIQTVLGFASSFEGFSKLLDLKLVGGFAKSAGALAGICAMVSGILSAVDAAHVNDTLGVALGVAAATSGLFSVAGFIATCICADGSAGAVAGEHGMVVGAVIGLVVGVVSISVEAFKSGARQSWEAMLTEFTRKDGPFDRVKTKAMSDDMDAVNDHGDWTFWDVNPTLIPQLLDLGFGVKMVAKIVNETTQFVYDHRQGREIPITEL